jgi:hypothetical protein
VLPIQVLCVTRPAVLSLQSYLHRTIELANPQEQQRQRQQRQQEQQQQRRQQEGQPRQFAEPDDAAPEGETEAAYLMRRAREFNVATRERPGDLQMWLDFAAFQDEALARLVWPGRIAPPPVCKSQSLYKPYVSALPLATQHLDVLPSVTSCRRLLARQLQGVTAAGGRPVGGATAAGAAVVHHSVTATASCDSEMLWSCKEISSEAQQRARPGVRRGGAGGEENSHPGARAAAPPRLRRPAAGAAAPGAPECFLVVRVQGLGFQSRRSCWSCCVWCDATDAGSRMHHI